jgi:hypothetical protein
MLCQLQSLLTAERNVIRNVALWLALAQPALAQTAPTAAPKPAPAKPSSTKPAAKKSESPKPEAAAQAGPCIGVIPHIGESFVEQNIGLTAFGNDLKEVPIESWELDDLIVARVRAAAGPRFAVRRMAQPANAFEPYDHPPLFHDPDVQIKRVVQTIAGGSGCERYVVVVESGANWGDSNQGVRGIGIVHRGGIIDRFSVTYLFAVTYLYVVDGHTFELLKKGAGSLTNETLGERLLNDLVKPNPLHAPDRELEYFAWPPTPDAVMGLREPTRALLAASLDKVLPGLLGP